MINLKGIIMRTISDKIEELYEKERAIYRKEANKFAKSMKRTGYLSKVPWVVMFNGDGNPYLGGVVQKSLPKLCRFLDVLEEHYICLEGSYDEGDGIIIETYYHKNEITISFPSQDELVDFVKRWNIKLDFFNMSEWKKSYQKKMDDIDKLMGKLSADKGKE
jgi:hypothetical protein